jgi:acetyl esterase/lipase
MGAPCVLASHPPSAARQRAPSWNELSVTALDEGTLAETRAFNEDLERRLASEPSVHTLPPDVTRLARREGRSIFPEPVFLPQARELTIPGRGGEIRLRILAPSEEATGVYLHIHGGGWVLGDCDEQDDRLWALAEATGLYAVSVGYRLAPEHPYPAALEDCEDAALWLLEQGLEELGAPDRLAIGGESAGAHLSVTTLLRLRDRHGITGAFRAANLVYGVYDLSMTPSQRNWGDRELVLSTPIMRWFGGCFVGDRDADTLRDPDLSPLYAHLHDLPPALFSVGEQDPLLDDSLFMAARWQAAGNQAELQVWPESVHGFTAFELALARAALGGQYEFLRSTLS